MRVVIAVTEATGHRAPGVAVRLTPAISGGAASARRQLANADGEAIFEAVPRGLYRLEILADGYATLVVRRFVVAPGKPGESAMRRKYRLEVKSAAPAPS